MIKTIDAIKRIFIDALMLYLLPGLMIFLPWSLAFILLKKIARIDIIYRTTVEKAWQVASVHFPNLQEHDWKIKFRLLKLVDQTDSYLTLFRGQRWCQRYVIEYGKWPEHAAPSVFLTYHWGAGNWIWPILRAKGIPAYFLARKPEISDLGFSFLAAWYGHFRAWSLIRIGSLGPLFTGGSAPSILRALHNGQSVMGMLDIPGSTSRRTKVLPLLDGKVRLPVGLANLARQANVSVTLFSFGLDFNTGRRTLYLEPLPEDFTAESILEAYVKHLNHKLILQSEAWQIWGEAPLLFIANDTPR